MDDLDENAHNGVDEQEESTDGIPSPLLSGTKLHKRLRSKVWDDFIPIFVDGKLVMAECKHCHSVLKCNGMNGTGSLLRHQANCSTGTLKRPRTEAAGFAGFDSKQKDLPFLPSSQKKFSGTTDEASERGLVVSGQPGALTDINRKSQEVQNGSHEELAVPPQQKSLASPRISLYENMKDWSHGEIPPPEQATPTSTNGKNLVVKQNCSHEEVIRVLSMHGHYSRMTEQDRFKRLFAYLNPMIKMPSCYDRTVDCWNLFQQEKSKLKEKLIALRSRICLSASMCHYDPRVAFLCLTVHYIDDEWKKQQKIIRFRPVDPFCNAKELSRIILEAVGEWHLDGKVFSIILDDGFIDDTVALDVKTSLQKWDKPTANRSLFVVRYATHLLDQVIQVGLDEFDIYVEKSAKFSKHITGPTSSVVQYANCRYAPSMEDWKQAQKLCLILEDFHEYMDSMHTFPSRIKFFDKLWAVKKKLHPDMHMQPDFQRREEEEFSKVREKMQNKFTDRWTFCFLHFCMPIVMDPKYRLKHIMSHLDCETPDDGTENYLQRVHDTLASLFNEYSTLKEDSSITSRPKTGKEAVVDGDMLDEQPLSEFDRYLQEPCLTKGESSVLQWWKEHDQTYPTVAQMACDILALPCSNKDCKVATKTARIAMTESGGDMNWVEELVCTQDWPKPAGMTTVE